MTITRFDRIAILPHRCSYCGRLFIWEPYNIRYREVGIEHHDLKQIQCAICAERK